MKTALLTVSICLIAGFAGCSDNRPGFELNVTQSSPAGYHVVPDSSSTRVTLIFSEPYPRYEFSETFPDYQTAVAKGISLRAVADDGTEKPFTLRANVCAALCEPLIEDCGDVLIIERRYQGTSDFEEFTLSGWNCHYADGKELSGSNDDAAN